MRQLAEAFSATLLVGCIVGVVAISVAAADPAPYVAPVYIQPLNFQTLFASPADVSPTDRIEREQALNFSRNLDLDDFKVTGFVASRRPEAAATGTADYRTYLGVRYRETLADTVQISGHTFYGAGTYDGDNSYVNPKGGALPEEVRADGKPIGQWVGTDWQVNTKLFDRESVQAGLEYRQPVTTHLFEDNRILGNLASTEDPNAHRTVAVSAGSSYALARDMSVNAQVRVDADTTGFEVGMVHQVAHGVRTGVSYGVQQIADPTAAGSAPGLERRLTKVNIGVPLLSERLATAFELQYNDIASPLLAAGRRNFVVGNLTVASAQIVRSTSVSFGLQNLFDTRGINENGQAIPFMPPDGRSVRLDLKRTF